MNEARLNLGVVHALSAESFGEPGQRTFRLYATTDGGTVSIWLEKEQIVALGNAVVGMLENIAGTQAVTPRPTHAAAQITGDVSARSGSLSLGFDVAQNAVIFEASDLWDATLDVQSIAMLADRDTLEHLEEQIDDIVAGGRPRCSMCGRPLGPGPHFCPPSNGHSHVLQETPTQ
jgi:uncharacterized repeat protein (TIGR03847 family)